MDFFFYQKIKKEIISLWCNINDMLFSISSSHFFYLWLEKIKNSLSRSLEVPPERIGKVVATLMLKFCFSYVFSTLQTLKEPLSVFVQSEYAQGKIAIIAILKGFGVLIFSFIFILIYNRLIQIFSAPKVFYGCIIFFLCWFLVYVFVLFPNNQRVVLSNFEKYWMARYPQNEHFILSISQWHHSLFFILAELWGQIILVGFFWQIANEVFSTNEAKKLFPLFIASGCMGGILGGCFSLYEGYQYHNNYKMVVKHTILSIVLVIFLILVIYTYFFYQYMKEREPKKLKKKSSFYQSFLEIKNDKYLVAIAITVVCCGISLGIVDLTWKGYVKLFFKHNQSSYHIFQSAVLITQLFFSILFCLRQWHISYNWLRTVTFGTYTIVISGFLFFLLSVFKLSWEKWLPNNISSILIIVVFGTLYHIAAKTSKYAFFDSGKELLFAGITDIHKKRKAKMSIDSFPSRLGKSGSSWLHSLLLKMVATSEVVKITPYLIPFLLGTGIIWQMTNKYLGKEIEKRIGKEPPKENCSKL